jgi:hypothetical protein
LYDTNDIGLFDEFINDLKEMLNEEKKWLNILKKNYKKQ